MNANVERLTNNAGIETVTQYEIEIWAKVEQAISGKNALDLSIRNFFDLPFKQKRTIPTEQADNFRQS